MVQKEKNKVQHSDLTQAQGQLASWRQWLKQPANRPIFDQTFVPSELRSHAFRPLYVLVYESRSEFNASLDLLSLRNELRREDEELMTFDRLSPSRDLSDCICVKQQQSSGRFSAISFPATVTFSPSLMLSWQQIDDGLESAIGDNKWISKRRRSFLARRLPYWRQWVASNKGINGISMIIGNRE